MANKDFMGFKTEDDTYNCRDDGARAAIGGLDSRVGIAESRITTLQGVTTDLSNNKANTSDLGTSAYKNSTSVVTDSTDLVESGAVKSLVGFGNKNIGVWNNVALSGDVTMGYKLIANGSSLIAPIKNNTNYTVSKKSTSYGNRFRIILFKNKPSFTTTFEISIIVNNSSELTEYTFNSGVYNYVVFTYESTDVITQDTAEAMIELGSVKTAYEPYHASVEESKCDNSVIGTVEDGINPTKSYAVGEHMIRGGKFCTVTSPVTTSSTWVEGSNYTSGDMASELEVQTGIATTSNTNVTIDSSIKTAFKQGHVVSLEVKFTLSADISTSSVVMSIPYIPKQRTHLSLANANYSINRCVELTTSGNIVTNSLESGTYTLYGSYIC